jgi:HK97 family phage major capsid protein
VTYYETKQRMLGLLEQARSIADTADADGRGFTPAERTRVKSLFDEAKLLKEQIKGREQDQDLRELINEKFGLGIELGSGHGRFGGGQVGGKAISPAASWSAKVLEATAGKALTSGSVAVPSLSSTISRVPDRPPTLLDLIPRVPLQGTDQFSYLKETVHTQAAAPVAAGTLKPTSAYTVVRVDDRVRTIAHISEPIPRQTLADTALLQQYVEGSLYDGVVLATENQAINGTGVGEQMVGLSNVSGIHVQALVGGDLLVTTRKAVTQLEMEPLSPSGWAFSPQDWEQIDLLADNEARYVLGGPNLAQPVDRMRRKLWGIDVATSTAVAPGVAFLVDFLGSTQLYEREAVQVDWSENVYDSTAAASDFQRNLIRFRGEGRFGFACTRPRGVVKVALV